MLRNLKSISSLDFRLVISVSLITTFPDVGVSSPPIEFKNVVLPDPEGPTIAVNSLAEN